MDQRSTFIITLKQDANINDEDKVHVQLAVLYTSSDKRRMVRVHNLLAFASNNPTMIFRYADLDTIVSLLVKRTAEKALTTHLNDFKDASKEDTPRNSLQSTVVDMLLKYRVHCSPHSPRGQLILPDSLKILPLYACATLKHPAFIENLPSIVNARRIPGQDPK